MKLLLDTHIILWSLMNPEKLSNVAIDLLQSDNAEIYYSTASVWEVAIKHMAKPESMKLSGSEFADMCKQAGYSKININDDHVKALETITRPASAPKHNDPFDRMLLAQAKAEGMRFVTHDSLIPYYDESCIFPV